MRRILKSIFVLVLCLTILPIGVYADGKDNADSGTGSGENAADKGGHYNSGEWMWKATIYVGNADTLTTANSFNMRFYKVGQPVFIKPSSFSVPKGTMFGKYNKADYLKGNGLSFMYSDKARIITDAKAPPIPITHKGGKIKDVKSYFGDTDTLIGIIDGVAEQQGTTREGLVANLEFTIDGESGTKDPKDILPVKNGNKYGNQVPWTIVYEPVIISYLNDGVTKLAFTATEYALAQKQGIFNFKFSGAKAQLMAGMTHINLPNSVTLEENWFGFQAYSPTSASEYWSEDRIIQGGGWGMRFMKPNRKVIEEEKKETYRVDTDVIISFPIATDGRATPNNPVTVSFYADGVSIGSMGGIVLPWSGGQLAWVKWHTPKAPTTATITASISGDAYFNGESTKIVEIVDLNENVPPDPVAKDPNTGKPIQAPPGYKVPKVPTKSERTSATWGEWDAYWEPDWVYYEFWDGEGGYWRDEGDWEYFWESYSASLTAQVEVKPDEKVPTATTYFSRWIMGSGYGVNIEVKTGAKVDAPESSYTKVQNVVNYFPEFNYDTYWRLSDKVSSTRFQLKTNEYSTYGQRVHFTPLWFPDGDYNTFSEVIDFWTPEGMLFKSVTDTVEIKGSVWDDWMVGPAPVD